MKPTLLIAAIALATATGAAFAVGPGKGPGGPFGMFDRADTDHDGMLTREEVDAAIAERSRSYDSDGNGAVSVEEFITGIQREREEQLRKQFEHMDSNGDGQLTASEMQAPVARLFAYADRNGDGILTKKELPHRGKGDHYRRGDDD